MPPMPYMTCDDPNEVLLVGRTILIRLCCTQAYIMLLLCCSRGCSRSIGRVRVSILEWGSVALVSPFTVLLSHMISNENV